MAFDHMTRVTLNRPIDDDEAARRVDVHKPVADEAADAHTVFGMNDIYLEVCDASYSQVGWCLLAFLIGFPGFVFLTMVAIQSAVEETPAMVKSGDQATFSMGMWFFAVVGALCCAFTIVLLLRDCFAYRHKSVRFNRKSRMVYAFRHNGPGGVVAVPWDRAFFFVQRLPSNSLFGGAPTLMRCYVLDDSGRKIVDTFSFGLRTVNGAKESTRYGKQVLYQVQANFEFIRRYMEEGSGSLPSVKTYLPRGPSLRASMSIWFYGLRDIGDASAGLRIFSALLFVPVLLLSLLHYIAQLTSREPVWPEDVEAACGNAQPELAAKV